MSLEQARERAEELREQLRRHDYLYYVLDRPEIADAAYDAMFRELQSLEAEHPELVTADSPTLKVGGRPLSRFPTVRHTAPMLSLDSDKEEAALARFVERVEKVAADPRFVLEPKFDGLSVELVWIDGIFERASTRGDGVRGEGVTENVKTIRGVPLRLRDDERPPPAMLAVRAEVIMPIADFEALNAGLLQEGKSTFANPRNAAAGTLRQLDPRVTASRPLEIYFYDVLAIEGVELDSQIEAQAAMRSWGLRVDPCTEVVEALDAIAQYHRRMGEARDELAYEIDGVVIKVDDFEVREAMGSTSRHPRWAFAYKFPPRKEETRIEAIIPSVGRTGIVTPVALMRPVDIGGVTVSRASLHNVEEIARLDVGVGDRVRVQRSGDVIPKVVEVLEPAPQRSAPFTMPECCPSCGAHLERRGPYTICPNGLQCPAQQAGRLQHFCSRRALDIEGVGEERARLLVDTGLVSHLPDLFDLGVEDLLELDGFAQKSAQNLIDAIARGAETELDRFLYGLGINGVGSATARDLATHFRSIDVLRHASLEALMEVPGVGEIVAQQIRDFFEEADNQRVLDELLTRIRLAEVEGPESQELAGVSFVFTGSLPTLTRAEAKAMAEARGARVSGSVSKKTDYVVAGEEAGSKLERAEALGVAVLDEQAFLELVGEG